MNGKIALLIVFWSVIGTTIALASSSTDGSNSDGVPSATLKPSSSPFASASRRKRFRVSEQIDPKGHRHSVFTAEHVPQNSGVPPSTSPATEDPPVAASPIAADRRSNVEGSASISIGIPAKPAEVIEKEKQERIARAIEKLVTHGGKSRSLSTKGAVDSEGRASPSASLPVGDKENEARDAADDDGNDDDLRDTHRWHHLRHQFHDAEALTGSKPIHEMTDEEIFHEAASDHVEGPLRGHTSRRRHEIRRLARQVWNRWNHYAEGGEDHEAPRVNTPRVPKPHELKRTYIHRGSEKKRTSEASSAGSLSSSRSVPVDDANTAKSPVEDTISYEVDGTPVKRRDPSHKVTDKTLHHQIVSERVFPHTSRKQRQTSFQRYPEREHRRKIRKQLQKNNREQLMEFHHKEDPSRCFAAANVFCPGLQYGYAEFIACTVVNETMFHAHDEHCKHDLVQYHRACASDMLVYCPSMASHETLQCLADIGDHHAKLLAKGVHHPELPLTTACFESEFMEIIRDSEHVKQADRPVTDTEKEVIRKYQEKHIIRPTRRQPHEDDPELDDEEEEALHQRRVAAKLAAEEKSLSEQLQEEDDEFLQALEAVASAAFADQDESDLSGDEQDKGDNKGRVDRNDDLDAVNDD